jgi:hypothetical protein
MYICPKCIFHNSPNVKIGYLKELEGRGVKTLLWYTSYATHAARIYTEWNLP